MAKRSLILCVAIAVLAFAGTARAASGWPVIDPSGLAPADPDYRVTIKPEGKPRGVVMAIHGGGWIGSTDLVDITRVPTAFLAEIGWQVEIVGYRSGVPAFADLERWHAKLRRSLDRRTPLCEWGQSAGAHMALLLAERLKVDCVIAEAGPMLLLSSPLSWDLPSNVHDLVRKTFGTLGLVKYSPLLANAGLRTPTLLAHATNDKTVPVGQSRAYRNAIANVGLVELDPGKALFVHSPGVDPDDVVRYHQQAKTLLRDAERRRAAAAISGPTARITSARSRLRGRRVPVRVRCGAAGSCRGNLRLVRSGKTVARNRISIAAGKSATLELALGRHVRKAIERRGRIRVAALARVVGSTGSAESRRKLVVRG